MAESPTPETGTPESQSPVRTPPALITTEELLQSMATKSPEAPTSPFEPSPSGSVSRARAAPASRYEHLRAADDAHRLRGLILPPEEELRAAALGGRPSVGPPPTLPHQLSPALQSVLHGWRSVYESCGTAPVLQALVGSCYAHDAVFEDALVSARGQEAVYRQFALLGAAVRAVQIAAYSLSVAPLSRPMVRLEPTAAGGASTASPPRAATAPPSGPHAGPQARLAQQPPPSPPPRAAAAAGASGVAAAAAGPGQQQQLHLTRVTVENVQCFELGMPPWLSWLVGGKSSSSSSSSSSSGLQIHLYVTSILLVASDAPLAMGLDGAGGGGGGGWAPDTTARRLAGVAAALDRDGVDPFAGGSGGGAAAGRNAAAAAAGGSDCPNWRIVHQVDVWHNVPMLWWRLRRSLCVALDALLAPLLRV